MGKIEEKKDRWYATNFGAIRLLNDNIVRFDFNDTEDDDVHLSIPLDEWREIVKFIGAESRRKVKEAL